MRAAIIDQPVVEPVRPDLDIELDGVLRLHDEEATELLLVRHAEPDRTEWARAEFGANVPLSCFGRSQALSLADRLSCDWVEAIYTAPERRAYETASILGFSLERPVFILHELRDIDYEQPDLQMEGTLARRFAREPRWDALPGFERSCDFRRRVILAVESVIAHHPAERLLIVSHAGVINAYLSMLLDVPRDLFFQPDHASVSVVRSRRDMYAVRTLNDTAHLEPDMGARAFTRRSSPLTTR